jgi:hypothetical protein
MKKIEKHWAFELPCLVGAVLFVGYLFNAVGIAVNPSSFAKFVIWCCCFWGSFRFLSFSLWLLVLALAPKKITGQG